MGALFSRGNQSDAAAGATRALNGRKLALAKMLGEGGSGTVWLARETRTMTQYALKIQHIVLEEQIDSFKSEALNHKLVQHRSIAPAIDWCIVPVAGNSKTRGVVNGDNVNMEYGGGACEGLLLLPFYEGGSLQGRIDKGERDVGRALDVFEHVCEGLLALHSLPTPHAFRDLKPANILIDKGTGILIDLGSVVPARVTVRDRKQALQLQELCAQTVTAPFRPPELFEVASDAELDERTDVFSLGCSIYAALYGQSPFDGSATAATSWRVPFLPENPSCPKDLQALIKRMVNPTLSERPFIPEVVAELRRIHGALPL